MVQQPLKGKLETTPKPNSVWISQGYGVAFDAYKGGFHLGIDLVPLDFTTRFYPALVYPILPATVRYFYETLNGKNSKCIVLDTWLDDDWIFYLKSLNKIPSSYTGKVRLMHTYFHGLEILVKQGEVDQDTPLMPCGNTGMVYSGGVLVPEEEKGMPPYRGGHLHLQCELYREDNIMIGFVDPILILNYKGVPMAKKYLVNDNGKIGVAVFEGFTGSVVFAKDMPSLQKLKESFEIPDDAPTINIP